VKFGDLVFGDKPDLFGKDFTVIVRDYDIPNIDRSFSLSGIHDSRAEKDALSSYGILDRSLLDHIDMPSEETFKRLTDHDHVEIGKMHRRRKIDKDIHIAARRKIIAQYGTE
jgi:hypothetical protein